MQIDKYIHTEKDKELDMLYIKHFSEDFDKKFNQQLGLSILNLEGLGEKEDKCYCVYYDYINMAQTVYFSNSNGTRVMIWLQVGINSNGIRENFFARSFTIKYQKKKEDKLIYSFYKYSIHDYKEVIEKFSQFLLSTKAKVYVS